MDYIYSDINNQNIDDNTDIEVTWTAYESLPNPSKLHYMTMAVLTVNGGDQVYLCIKQANAYKWKLICRAAGQLIAPTIISTGTAITWAAVADAVSYDIYVNDILLTNITTLSYDMSSYLEGKAPGSYKVCVVAKAAQGSEFEDSEKSNVVEFIIKPCYFKYVNDAIITDIPDGATKIQVPDDYKTNGIIVSYTTVGEQYEYFAYPADIPDVVDIMQSGQHVLGNYTKQANATKGSIEHKVYRTTLPQVYDDSTITYFVFAH